MDPNNLEKNEEEIEELKRVEDEMIPYFPLGIFKERKTPDAL